MSQTPSPTPAPAGNANGNSNGNGNGNGDGDLAGAWAAALDQFEQHLVSYQRVLSHDGDPAEAPWPPAELAGCPVPRELVPRARDLLARAARLETELQDRQNTMRLLALQRPRHLPAHPRPSRHSTLL